MANHRSRLSGDGVLGFSEVWVGGELSTRMFLRLRWLAVSGQGLAAWGAHELGVSVPWGVVGLLVGVTALTNLILEYWRRLMGGHLRGAILHVLLLDLLTLTAILYSTGGLENPFSVFLLVQVALAAVTLKTVAVVCLGVGMLAASLFLWKDHQGLEMRDGGDLPETLLWLGKVIALPLAAATIASLLLVIRRRAWVFQQQAEEFHRRVEDQDRFLSVAALATGFAHELATPISTILITAEEMKGDEAALILGEAKRCQDLMTRLRFVEQESRESGAACEAVGTIVDGALAELSTNQLDRLAREVRCPAARVVGNGVKEALLVILRNAFQSSESDGPVELLVDVEKGQVSFKVRDFGTGFDADSLRHWGEPFRTSRPGGMGLGLYFARRLASARGGRVDVANLVDGGASVHLKIPTSAE